MIPLFRILLLLATLALSDAANSESAVEADDGATLQAQRTLFLQTRAQLQNGQSDAAAGLDTLKNYPLYPYLELLQLNANFAQQNGGDIDNFLQRYPDTVLSAQLRTQWLAVLAEGGRWADYLKYYAANDASKLQQCWYLEALYQTQQNETALKETTRWWLSTDMPDACDEPFKRWLNSAQRSEPLVWQRLLLALERKQEQLGRFLAVQINEPYKLSAEYALMLYRDPTALANLLPLVAQLPEASKVIALALKNLARRDADAATQLWQQTVNAKQLAAEDSNAVRAEIGRQQIAARGSDALPWLLQYDANGDDPYLLEWRVRLALQSGNWAQIAQWIELLPPNLAQTPRWSYWRARALAEQHDDAKRKTANSIFNELAKDRSYYGFLAADRLQNAYQFNDQRLRVPLAPETLTQRPAILRAREFYALGEQASARREWQNALRTMKADEQQSAALLAEQWGWFDQSIRTATQTGAMNDLQLRFPLAYRAAMTEAAKNTALPTQWLFAIARQESAFMPDARSPVGALGLLQLMPDTARQIARGLRTRIATEQLVQPEPSIRLGSVYLSELLRRYRGNRILATAAYNAGPNRISNLLKNQTAPISSDIWVETLPYHETRDYVQNVLAFAVIYAHRLGQPGRLFSTEEIVVTNPAVQVSAE